MGREREIERESERESFVCLVGFFTSSSTTRLYRGRGSGEGERLREREIDR